MALYAIGDLHLCAQTPDKSMDVMGRVWVGHEEKFRANCAAALSNADTLVLCGDHSWGRKLADCMEDLAYIEALPGRKILLRGNHDMFWDAKKTERLNQQFEGRLHFLQNNYYTYEDYALVGTKGYTFEGPFYLDRHGRIRGWDEEAAARAEKLVEREYERLKISFESAARDGYQKFIMFLHYPPTNVFEKESCFTRLAEKYHVEQVIYAHCHGEARFHDSIQGTFHGIDYSLVSGDYLRWHAKRIL